MDDLEKNTIHNEENPNPPVFHTPYESQDTSYYGAGSGRKESPYADSPYVLQHPVNTGTAPARKQKTRKLIAHTTSSVRANLSGLPYLRKQRTSAFK